jgi:hypothetical protein
MDGFMERIRISPREAGEFGQFSDVPESMSGLQEILHIQPVCAASPKCDSANYSEVNRSLKGQWVYLFNDLRSIAGHSALPW